MRHAWSNPEKDSIRVPRLVLVPSLLCLRTLIFPAKSQEEWSQTSLLCRARVGYDYVERHGLKLSPSVELNGWFCWLILRIISNNSDLNCRLRALSHLPPLSRHVRAS